MEGKASGNAEVDEQCRNLKKEIYQRWESNILQRTTTAVSGPSSSAGGFVPVRGRRSPATVAPADGSAAAAGGGRRPVASFSAFDMHPRFELALSFGS